MTKPQHIAAAGAAGAVIGFALMWSSLLGVEILTPLAILPAVKRDWKASWVHRDLISEISVYLASAGCLWDGHTVARKPSRFDRARRNAYAWWVRARYRAPACDPAAVPFVAAYHRRLSAVPALSRNQVHSIPTAMKPTRYRQAYQAAA